MARQRPKLTKEILRDERAADVVHCYECERVIPLDKTCGPTDVVRCRLERKAKIDRLRMGDSSCTQGVRRG